MPISASVPSQGAERRKQSGSVPAAACRSYLARRRCVNQPADPSLRGDAAYEVDVVEALLRSCLLERAGTLNPPRPGNAVHPIRFRPECGLPLASDSRNLLHLQ